MKKDKLKLVLRARQRGLCAITGLPLPEDTSMFDAERIVPKSMGGEYTLDNLAGGVAEGAAATARRNEMAD